MPRAGHGLKKCSGTGVTGGWVVRLCRVRLTVLVYSWAGSEAFAWCAERHPAGACVDRQAGRMCAGCVCGRQPARTPRCGAVRCGPVRFRFCPWHVEEKQQPSATVRVLRVPQYDSKGSQLAGRCRHGTPGAPMAVTLTAMRAGLAAGPVLPHARRRALDGELAGERLALFMARAARASGGTPLLRVLFGGRMIAVSKALPIRIHFWQLAGCAGSAGRGAVRPPARINAPGRDTRVGRARTVREGLVTHF